MKKLNDYPYRASLCDPALTFETVIKPLVDDISIVYDLPKRLVKKLIVNALTSNTVENAIFDEVQYILGDESK